MNIFWLMWLMSAIFALAICWDAGVRHQHRVIVMKILMAIFILFNIYAQTEFFRSDRGVGVGSGEVWTGQQTAEQVRLTLSQMALTQGGLRHLTASQLYRTLTSTLLHYGWLSLFFNLWFVWVIGRALETVLGWKRFLPIALMGLVTPAALEGFAPMSGADLPDVFRGGASGLVYCLLGAAVVCFPRARCHIAINLDVRFWGIALGILLPITLATRHAGLPLTEMIILVGLVGVFLLLQPEHGDLRIPLGIVIVYKILQDLVLLGPLTQHVLHNSPWRIIGGGAVGVLMGLLMYGIKGIKARPAAPAPPLRSRHQQKKASRQEQARLEANAATDEDLARRLLAQKVFIADSDSLTGFYESIVMAKFPAMVLPARDQMAMARMLKYKGKEAAALHAYENLLRTHAVDDDDAAMLITTAELVLRCDPARGGDAKSYLEQFLSRDHLMLRDKMEAQRMLQELGEIQAGAHEVSKEQGADQPANTDARKAEVSSDLIPLPDLIRFPRSLGDEKEIVADKPPTVSPIVDFPRLPPRSFSITEQGVSAPHLTRRLKTGDSNAGDAIDTPQMGPVSGLQKFWKPLSVESRSKLDGDAILKLKIQNGRNRTSQALSGNYAAPGDGTAVRSTPAGRAAKLETRRNNTGPSRSYGTAPTKPAFNADKSARPIPIFQSAATAHHESSIARPYGLADITPGEAERTAIRLKSEKVVSPQPMKRSVRRRSKISAEGDDQILPDRIKPKTAIPAGDGYSDGMPPATP